MAITPTQKYGIKIARPGYNIKTAPDWAQIYNSSWPALATAFEADVDMDTLDPVNVTTLTHNLGIYPVTMAWESINGTGYGRAGGDVNLIIKQNTLLVSGNPVPGGHLKIRCYNVDLTQDNTWPLLEQAAVKLAYDSRYGIKVVKSGKNINSKDLRDFIIHSRAQSPNLIDVVTTDNPLYFNSTTGTLTYPLRTPNIPWVAGYIGSGTGRWKYYDTQFLSYSSSPPSLSVSGVGPPGQPFSFVVMRDPLFPPNNISVVI